MWCDKHNFGIQRGNKCWLCVEEENSALESQLAEARERVTTLEAIVEKQVDDGCDKILAMTDEQISALCRLEGHDPDDEAKLAKQAAEIAILKHKLRECQSRADQDRADAERYRWLRFRTLWEPNSRLKWKCCLTRDELDAAIDAARATQKERGGGV